MMLSSFFSRFAFWRRRRTLSDIVVADPSGFSPPHHIVVSGVTCAGKSTLAKSLSSKHDLEHIEMDKMYWGANWTPNPSFETEISSALERCRKNGKGWCIEGVDYSRHGADVLQSIVLRQSTTFIHLDICSPVLFWRLLKRTLRRVIWKEKVCGGNVETFRQQFMSRQSVFCFLWDDIRNDRLGELFDEEVREEQGFAHLNMVKIRNGRDLLVFQEADLFEEDVQVE